MNIDAKIINKIITNRIQQHIKHCTSDVYSRNAKFVSSQYLKIKNAIHHISRLNQESHQYNNWFRKKSLKNLTLIYDKTLHELKTKGSFLNLIKSIYKNLHLTEFSMVKSWIYFAWDWEQGKDVCSHHVYST